MEDVFQLLYGLSGPGPVGMRQGRTKRLVNRGRAVTKRVPDDRMQLHVPVDRLTRFAER